MSEVIDHGRRRLLRLSAAGVGAAVFGAWPEREGRSAPLPRALASKAPTAPVAIGRCPNYDLAEVQRSLSDLFHRIGGVRSLVNGRTVTMKVNATGGPSPCLGRSPLVTYHTHPAVVHAAVALLTTAGAKRIRIVECAPERVSLEQFLVECGWPIREIRSAGAVEFENTRNLGLGKRYVRLKVPGGGLLLPAFDLNHSYEDTDVFVSLAKLKAHTSAGVTVCMKNLFGITPNSLYGNDAGSEDATGARLDILHNGWAASPKGVPAPMSVLGHRDQDRVPRVVVDLVRARPVDLSIVDGIASVAGGEGPWVDSLQLVNPRVLLAGRNPLCTDAVATAVMGYDPTAPSRQGPFPGDNLLTLGAAAGIGENRLERIEVLGTPVAQVRQHYGKVYRA